MNRIKLIKNITNNNAALNIDIDKIFENGDFIHLCGKSGAGKTSILKMIAGILKPDKGLIEINEECWYDSKNKQNVVANKRDAGLVFQDYALFPNMDVLRNILFAAKDNNRDYLDKLLKIAEIEDLKKRKINTLSGGEQQRVAFVRTLIRKPSFLLLDEPFSALDEKVKVKMQEFLVELNEKEKVTIIFVSHSDNDFIKMSGLKVWRLVDGEIK